MKERIDKFMKAVREKYEGQTNKRDMNFELLYKELLALVTGDEKLDLLTQWTDFQQELKLLAWDDKFTELLINGTKDLLWPAAGGLPSAPYVSTSLTPEQYYAQMAYEKQINNIYPPLTISSAIDNPLTITGMPPETFHDKIQREINR